MSWRPEANLLLLLLVVSSSAQLCAAEETCGLLFPTEGMSLVGLAFTAFQRDGNAVPQLRIKAIREQAAVAKRVGVDYLILGGTTDEWPSLSLGEREKIAREWRAAVPAGQTPKLILHTGSDCLVDAQHLGSIASELQYDAVLVSTPGKFTTPSLEAHVESLQAALSTCGDLPALYYSFPPIYGDDFDLDQLLRAVRKACPTVVGAKLCGVTDSDATKAWQLEDFAIIKTGHTMLPEAIKAGVEGWACYLWEVDAARALIRAAGDDDANTSDYSNDGGSTDVQAAMERLSALRTAVLHKRAIAPHSNYQMSADKAFMSAWSGVDVGKCRLPLPSLDDQQEATLPSLVRELANRGLLVTITS